MEGLIPKLKQASLLWLHGLLEACCLHRVVIYCLRSRQLAKRTGQCFLFNGLIFLGSIVLLNSVIIPTLQWILPDQCPQNGEPCSVDGTSKLYSFLRLGLLQLFYVSHSWPPTNESHRCISEPYFDRLIQPGEALILLSTLEQTIRSLEFLNLKFLEKTVREYSNNKRPHLYKMLNTSRLTMRKLITNEVFWFYPLYVFSFILSTMWYNDIAKFGFLAMGKRGPTPTEMPGQQELSSSSNASQMDKRIDLGGAVIGIAEQVYSVILLNIFFLEVYVTGLIPYVGKPLNLLLISWMYAYYCFEYKWNFSGLSLDKRLYFFESNWAFFAGFGSPCVLPILFFPPLVSYGVLAILYPLFVLTAAGSDADELITSQRRKWKGAGLGRLPIFYAADYISMRVLSFFPMKSRDPIHVN